METTIDLRNTTGQDISVCVNGDNYKGEVISCDSFELHIKQKEPRVKRVKCFFDATLLLFDKGVHRNQIYIPYSFEYKGQVKIRNSSSLRVDVAYKKLHVKVSISPIEDLEIYRYCLIETISDDVFRSFCVLIRSNIIFLMVISFALLMLFLYFGGGKAFLLALLVMVPLNSIVMIYLFRIYLETKKVFKYSK